MLRPYMVGFDGIRKQECKNLMILGIRPLDFAGFALVAAAAVYQEWSLQEFCWSTWLAGLFYAWACIVTAAFQIVLTASSERGSYEQRLKVLRQLPSNVFLLGVLLTVTLVVFVAFRLYTYIFGFYGLFLSVFAEMEPHSLFGRDGFINSDFFTPVAYLFKLYWPMVLGTLAANGRELFGPEPWKRVALPLRSEILRMHVLTLALPFVAMLAFFLFRDRYHQPAIVVLMGIFFLVPRKGGGRKKMNMQQAAD